MTEMPATPEATDLTQLNLTPEQKSDLVIWLNMTLRDSRLKQNYANRLHGMFQQLTGKTHDVWESLGGQYVPETQE